MARVELGVDGLDLPSPGGGVVARGNAVDTLDNWLGWVNGDGPSETNLGAVNAVDAEDGHWESWLGTLTGLEGGLAGEGC